MISKNQFITITNIINEKNTITKVEKNLTKILLPEIWILL